MFNWFRKKNNNKVSKADFPLVWTDDDVKLTTESPESTYEFKDFTGFIKLYGEKCYVQNANFVYHISNMSYIKDTASPLHPYDIQCNYIDIHSGSVAVDDTFRFRIIENTTVNGGTIYCRSAINNIINTGEFYCREWEAEKA